MMNTCFIFSVQLNIFFILLQDVDIDFTKDRLDRDLLKKEKKKRKKEELDKFGLPGMDKPKKKKIKLGKDGKLPRFVIMIWQSLPSHS